MINEFYTSFFFPFPFFFFSSYFFSQYVVSYNERAKEILSQLTYSEQSHLGD